MRVLAPATAALPQGPALSRAGTDLLRSKSLDRNSYDCGDWCNAVHWNRSDGNGFGRGLAMAADNEPQWPCVRPLLGSVRVDCPQIESAWPTTAGSDAVVKDVAHAEGAFTVPARTVAVFTRAG
jgi:hypothetical protein